MNKIKFTGSSSVGCMLSMDKIISKELIVQTGIPTAEWLTNKNDINELQAIIPCFVKPADNGSSVGVTKVTNKEALEKALDEAARFSDDVLVEKQVVGREFSVGVLDGKALPPIEIIATGEFYDYKVKYSEYVVLRKERREQQLRAFDNQQKMLADTEAFIERFRYKATKSVQVQSRIKQLEKIERIEVDEVDTAMLNLKFPPAPRSGSYPVIIEDVAKRYGDHLVFEKATFTINRGDKVAFVGKNGEGKSTLVKCIMGEISDFTGKLELGHNVKIGYFAQNQAQLLNENMTVFDTIDYVAQGDIRLKIRDILGAFMFGGEASDKKVKVLSGGEKTRLAMIRLLLEPVNLLILDEPTNHLDMRSKDVLKDALKDFDGTVILVSHDREFLDGLVDKVYEFGNKKVVEHLGGIYDFLEHKKLDSLQELERSTQQIVTITTEVQPTQNKLSYEARKEQNKAIRRVEKAIAESEKKIEDLEKAIAGLEEKLATPEGAADVSLYGEYSELKQQLSETMDLWTEQTIELEELNNS
jgi:ATP-binding cassette subfamily F protein 3